MNKEYLENKLAEGFSTNQIAKELKITTPKTFNYVPSKKLIRVNARTN